MDNKEILKMVKDLLITPKEGAKILLENEMFHVKEIVNKDIKLPYKNVEALKKSRGLFKSREIYKILSVMEKVNVDDILELAPFIESEDLIEILIQAPDLKHADILKVISLIDKEDIYRLIKKIEYKTYKNLSDIASFLDQHEVYNIANKISDIKDVVLIAPFLGERDLYRLIKGKDYLSIVEYQRLRAFLDEDDYNRLFGG